MEKSDGVSEESGKIVFKVWPVIQYHLLGALGLAGILLFFGLPNAGVGLLFGAILGTLNAAVLAKRLDDSVAIAAGKQNIYLYAGTASRFCFVLLLMGMGFYFFQLHVVSLVSGFILFQIMCLFVLWREAREANSEKNMVVL
tara:strand:+ start:3805 stop:4230 length:426 start_codon:yes stop_codon:yes gene_type:complete